MAKWNFDIIKKRNLIIISIFIIIVITFIFCLSALTVKPISSKDVNHIKVVLDAGHGGIDGGTTGIKTGVKESEINLQVVKKLENYFMGAGIDVVLTRSSDAGLYGIATNNLKKKDMQKRKEIIQDASPTLVISVHMNKYSVSTRRGAQVFFNKSSDLGKNLAISIQNEFNSMEQAVKSYSPLTGDYYILNCTTFPSVICECGFLSNEEDEALLLTSEYQDKIAYAIFKGTAGYLAQNSFKYFD